MTTAELLDHYRRSLEQVAHVACLSGRSPDEKPCGRGDCGACAARTQQAILAALEARMRGEADRRVDLGSVLTDSFGGDYVPARRAT